MEKREDLVLMAAGRIEGPFAEEAGETVKALIRLDGRTMLERVMDAFAGTGRIGRTVIVGPEAVRAHPAARRADVVLPERENAFAGMETALDWLRESGGAEASHVLVAATDLPFLTPEAIDEFIDACSEEAGICLSVTEREEFAEGFPGITRTWVRLREGEWKIGGVVRVRPDVLLRNRERLRRLFELRKSPLALARLFGFGFILRFLFHRLTMEQIERRLSEVLGCTAAAVRDPGGRLAFDIDDLRAYRGALDWLGRSGAMGEPGTQPGLRPVAPTVPRRQAE